MICRNCNTVNEDNAKFCAKCGAALFSNNQPGYVQPAYTPARPAEAPQPAKGLAIAAMVCSLVGFGVCGLSSLPGLILGIIAKSKGNTSGMSTTGIVCGAIGTGLYTIIWIWYMCVFAALSI